MRDGLDGATIDAISDRAFVCPRTFFNYFDSKEDALLGIPDVASAEEALPAALEHAAYDDLVENIINDIRHVETRANVLVREVTKKLQ